MPKQTRRRGLIPDDESVEHGVEHSLTEPVVLLAIVSARNADGILQTDTDEISEQMELPEGILQFCSFGQGLFLI